MSAVTNTREIKAYELWAYVFEDDEERGAGHIRERKGMILAYDHAQAVEQARTAGYSTEYQPYADYHEVDPIELDFVSMIISQ